MKPLIYFNLYHALTGEYLGQIAAKSFRAARHRVKTRSVPVRLSVATVIHADNR